MNDVQKLKTLTYMVYTIINNICVKYTECAKCFMDKKDGSEDCRFHSRIDNNILIKSLFYNRLDTFKCCDDYCNTCELNHLTDNNDTCGFSILADHIIKDYARNH